MTCQKNYFHPTHEEEQGVNFVLELIKLTQRFCMRLYGHFNQCVANLTNPPPPQKKNHINVVMYEFQYIVYHQCRKFILKVNLELDIWWVHGIDE